MPGLVVVKKQLDQKIDIDFTLRKVFGKKFFRPVQRDVVDASLEGRDVYLQAATSFGKSLCFQLPAVVNFGITIVISPLLALMNNQLAAMRAAGISVATINSTTPHSEKTRVMDDLKSGHPRTRLLYVTPEYCAMDNFRRNLRIVHDQRELARIAIDEAHCRALAISIVPPPGFHLRGTPATSLSSTSNLDLEANMLTISEWGHGFRPSFKQLDFFRKEFPEVPMICCTATATQRVRTDIMNTLALDESKMRSFIMTTHRPNLHYELRYKSDEEDHYDDFLSWIRAIHERRLNDPKRQAELQQKGERATNVSGIIYTLYRKDTEALAARLRHDGIGAKPYHAGLSTEQKEDHLTNWVANTEGYDVIVATTAFGMGIDKENVRFVVHWQIPKSFEGYYQEAGRAGRDGKAALCITYYGREDRDRAAQMMGREVEKIGTGNAKAREAIVSRGKSLQALIAYCENTSSCRHKMIAEYFGDQTMPKCEYACDWHKEGTKVLLKKKDKFLASEEWCATQRQAGTYSANDPYD